ncbi:MAG: FecR domain-containing protein [Fidelibacterota bacterium]|nr:MAG: FecR domain-containing protein [Candidatus Neomarinimicrobiota bacterium]
MRSSHTIPSFYFFCLRKWAVILVVLTVTLPLWAQEEPVARVVKSRGEVLLRREATPDFNATIQPAMDLYNGDAIRAGEDGFASVIFLDDKTLLKVKASTQFQFVESENARTLDLQYGTLRSTLPQPIKSFRVETPVSVASVKGTDFWLIHDLRAGVDRAYGLEGVVEILNTISQITQNLTPNTMIISTAGGQVTPPIPVRPEEMPTDPDEEVPEPEPEAEPQEEGVEEEVPEAEPDVGEAPGQLEELFIGEEPPVEEPPVQAAEEEAEEAAEPKKAGPGLGLGLGSVTLDDQVYYQIALRPELTFGKVGIGLDIVGYMDAQGNFRKDEWDEPSDYLDKVLYFRYGTDQDPFFFKIGAMPSVQYGFGALMNNYSNMAEFPQVRRVGFEIGGRIKENFSLKGFTADLKEFGDRGGLVGLRGSYRLSKSFPLTLGVNFVGDLNQYGGLKDKDEDGRPDILDDFPDDEDYWLDSDENGVPDDIDPDIDGDGFTDNSPDPANQPNSDIDGIARKPEPFSKKDTSRVTYGLSVDLSYPVISKESFGLVAYTEVGMMNYGGELTAITTEDTLEKSMGFGVVGPGLRAQILKFINVSLEYRYSSPLFVPGFFNSTYDFERAQIQFLTTPNDSSYVETKDQAIVNNAYALSGYYGSASANLFNLVTFSAGYQQLSPSKADTSARDYNSFIAQLDINTDPIPKISEATAYYVRTNDDNPFDFKNPSSNTTWGYRLGYELGPGVSLIYNQQVSYRFVAGEVKEVRLLTIETAFNF